MNASAPITIDGKQFDKFSLNLAISGRYESNGTPDACINLLLTPTRIEAGEVITAPEAGLAWKARFNSGLIEAAIDEREQTLRGRTR